MDMEYFTEFKNNNVIHEIKIELLVRKYAVPSDFVICKFHSFCLYNTFEHSVSNELLVLQAHTSDYGRFLSAMLFFVRKFDDVVVLENL